MWDPGVDLFRGGEGGLHVCTPLSFFGLSSWKSSFTLILAQYLYISSSVDYSIV